jgi:penicillin-insensitive murein endopeptidase
VQAAATAVRNKSPTAEARIFRCYDRSVRALFIVAISVVVAVRAHAGEPTPWAFATTPAPGPAQAIGKYGGGCIRGAVALPLEGKGFRVARPERGRVFGHPLLVAMLRDLGTRAKALGLPFIAVGDLGQPRGGPAPTGHASHQTGLDVDLGYTPIPPGGAWESMVDDARKRPTARFDGKVARLLMTAATDARVDRIFVNPILKRALCASTKGERAWLRKIRPWWGHHDHFHVRLACPPDSPACEPQPPLPDGDGCGELDWWLNPKAEADRDKGRKDYQSRVGGAPPMPAACLELVADVAVASPIPVARPASTPTDGGVR